MDMNPQRVRSAQFKTVKRGLDPDEVQLFLDAVAGELERAQNQSTAMEARARAAVARVQELSNDAVSHTAESLRSASSEGSLVTSGSTAAGISIDITVDQSETITRTLLLAQRTADTAVAEARAEAQRLREEAEAEIAETIESSRVAAQALLADVRAEARKAGEREKVELAGEVDSLMARRDFLESDVDHMEQFLVAQRSRLRDAANEIMELTERVPSGLGESRRPLLSAATEGVIGTASPGNDDDSATPMEPDDSAMEIDNPATDDDLWLPDDVLDTSAVTADDELSAALTDEGPSQTMKFGFERDND
ncbi:MAG: DivIVA domain-containing protein [Actinomycetota bacterium]|jgi:DivIVA domain-containing protein|uniref:DivIVA domain-containing protein n=1 Tax=uncultured Ilumatobacter sp. TaxID=879968 RepID=UPI00374EBBC0|nr:DivIVA domain-containing protein [Actinomycetota bacterium]